jgi:hypothetical protein
VVVHRTLRGLSLGLSRRLPPGAQCARRKPQDAERSSLVAADPPERDQVQRTYNVVLRARSAARFKPEEGNEFLFASVPDCQGAVRFRTRTRWVNEGHEAPLPRELWIEGRGPAPSLDLAVSRFTAIARYLTTLIAFTANTQVGTPEAHIAFDATNGERDRDFLEVFLPDERGHPSEGRLVQIAELTAVFAGLDSVEDAGRVARALDQYGLALRYWYFGGEWLALTHLYMAVETLTKAVVRHRCKVDEVAEEALAETLGIDVTNADKWQHELEVWARKEVIFQGDLAAYRKARHASDGVEHGFLELDKVHREALAVTEITFKYVRQAILELIHVERVEFPELYDRLPRDVQSLRRMIRGHFVGDGTDPAPMGEEYPHLEWNSSVTTWRREGDRFTSALNDKFVVRCSPEYSFSGAALEVRGRTEPGSPLHLDVSVEVGETSPSSGLDTSGLSLMQRAKAFADDVTGHGETREVPAFLDTVFGMSAVQTSLFEAIELLLRDNRPAQAIVLLRNLLEGACLLEVLADDQNVVGNAVRLKLDSMARQEALYASDAELTRRIQDAITQYQQAARGRGIEIPDVPLDVTKSRLYAESSGTLAFAQEVARGGVTAIALLTVTGDDGMHAFHTRVPDQRMTLGVAADAATALIKTTVSLARIMKWPFDAQVLGSLETDIERITDEQ